MNTKNNIDRFKRIHYDDIRFKRIGQEKIQGKEKNQNESKQTEIIPGNGKLLYDFQ